MNFKKMLLFATVLLLIAGPTVSYTTTFQGVRLIEEQFTSFDGTKLTGTVILPQGHTGTDRAPLIVLMHGFTVSKEFFYLIGAELARHGYVCFSFNARGHQTSGNESSLAFYEIADFQTAITYMLSKSTTYGINTSQVGIIGHSHGAMCATIVGAIDPRVNATIPISTGANLSNVINKFLGIGIPSVYDAVRNIMNFGLDFTDPTEADLRSTINYVNASYPSNLLLINGDLDEAFSIQENKELLAKAVWNDSGRAAEIEPGRLYTNSSGLRRLVVEHNVDHLMEAFMPETLNETVAWMDLTFYGGLRSPVNTTTILYMFSGIMLTLLGALTGFLALTAALTGWLHKKVKQRQLTIPETDLKDKALHFGIYLVAFAVVNLLVPLIILNLPALHSWIPILAADLLGVIFVFQALLTLPILLLVLRYETKKFGTTLADHGLGFKGMGSAAIIGLITGLFFVAIVSLAVSDFILKIIPADLGNFILVFLSFLPYIFVMELWGRGLIQMKLTDLPKAQYTEVFVSAIAIGIIQAVGTFVFYTVFQWLTGSPTVIIFNENIPPINMALAISVLYGAVFFGVSILGGYLFKKTRNILSSTLLITLLLSWILTAWPPRFI
jgi:cephalosporin-C deacetylase-like acetyl esterase